MNHFMVDGEKPMFVSLLVKIEWSTQSNAFLKSIKTARLSWLLSMASCMSSVKSLIVVIVKWFARYPVWASLISLFDSRYLVIWFETILSIIFPGSGSREIGLKSDA